MPDDVRLQTTILRHYKFRKLRQRLGDAGFIAWLSLVFWVADNRADGDLSGLTGEDFEMIVEWHGCEGALVSELISLRLLDGEPGSFRVHEWQNHQPYIAERPKRIAKARKAAGVRWKRQRTQTPGKNVAPPKARSYTGTEFVPVACSKHAERRQDACNENAGGNAPSLPLPSPPLPHAVPVVEVGAEVEEGRRNSASPTAAVIVPSFYALGHKPFGPKRFQEVWAEEWSGAGEDTNWTDIMEQTIQRCKSLGVKVPGLFFQHKHQIEKGEVEMRYKVTPK